jgi:hypothetical protein
MAAILVGPSQNYCFGVDVLEKGLSAFGFKWEGYVHCPDRNWSSVASLFSGAGCSKVD